VYGFKVLGVLGFYCFMVLRYSVLGGSTGFVVFGFWGSCGFIVVWFIGSWFCWLFGF